MQRVKLVATGTVAGMNQGSECKVIVLPYEKKLAKGQFLVYLTFDPEDPMETVIEVDGVE